MAPCFLFLASSLNVELVYSILKGITKFGYITLFDPNDTTVNDKRQKMRTLVEKDATTLTITQLKIKDYKTWNDSCYQDFVQDTWVKRTANPMAA